MLEIKYTKKSYKDLEKLFQTIFSDKPTIAFEYINKLKNYIKLLETNPYMGVDCKKKGIKIGNIVYDEIPKVMIIMAVQDHDKDDIVSVLLRIAKTSEKGAFGDGKIFVSPLEEAYTVSTGAKEL